MTSPHAPSLSQAIALGLTGTADPVCQLCGAPAFVWADGEMFCQSWWQQGWCACRNCGGPHHIQRCPEILSALLAPPEWDGQKIARAFHGNYNRFIATLLTPDVVTRARWAVEYAAYISPFNKTGTPLTAEHVARIWNKALERSINFPPRAA